MKQETFPFWQFLVRGAAAIGWTAMCLVMFLAVSSLLVDPTATAIIALPCAVNCLLGHYRLIQLFDFIFELGDKAIE